mgnify:CR=1 FL=1
MAIPLLVPAWPAPAGVRALCTTRAGGVSVAPFDSFNLGDHVRDEPLAVAANLADIALGTDTGGSVRIPAAWCGVVGLKPSLGRIPMNVLPGLWDTLSHHGPLARTVDCVRSFMSAVSGPSLLDPLSHIIPMGNTHVDISALRVAWSVDLGCWSVDKRIAAAITQTVDSMRGSVASVVDAPG